MILGSNSKLTSRHPTNSTTNPMPPLSPGAGNGSASMNIVITGAIKDMSQPTACENQRQDEVPNASRRIRTLAMSMAEVAAADVPESVGIGEDAVNTHPDPGDRIEYPAVARVNDNRRLRADAHSHPVTRLGQAEINLHGKTLLVS